MRNWREISKRVIEESKAEEPAVVLLDDWEGDYPVDRFRVKDEVFLKNPEHPKAVRKFMWEHRKDPVLQERGAAIYVARVDQEVFVGYGGLE